MEGLIKGILDVALGDHDDYNNNSKNKHGGESESNNRDDRDREERSRSSWAEVVSGDKDDDDRPSNNDRNQGYGRNHKEESRYGRNEETESAGYQPSRRPQKEGYQGYQRAEEKRPDGYSQSYQNQKPKEEEGSNDGWETVGKKPPRRHQQVQKDNWSNFKRPADEQDYSTEVAYDSNMEPTEEELADLSRACNKLWELDLNRLTPGKDYRIDCGEGKKVYQNQDMAEGTLFSSLSKDALRRPTFSRFCSLLDNYNPHEGYKEKVTSQERQEQAAFIEEISRTAPIKYLHKYLFAKRIVSENYQEFKRVLTSIWFDLYGRGGTSGCSSAFEHVFVGEIKQRGEESVSGFHNWLQFYLEEAKGRVDYQGYIFPRRRGQVPDSETQLLTIQFEWNGVLKSVSSTLVGVSPEFEVALYTLCFYMGGEDNYVELGPYPVNIKCYRLGNKIGSVFPIADS